MIFMPKIVKKCLVYPSGQLGSLCFYHFFWSTINVSKSNCCFQISLSVSNMPWLIYIYIYMTVKSNMWTEAFKRCCLFAMGYLYEYVYAQDNHGWCWWSWCIIIIRLEYRTDTLLKLCALSCSAVQFLIECSITLQTHKQGSCSSVCINGFCPVYSLLCFLQSFLFSQIGKVLAPSSSKIMQSTESTELLLE